jgi:YhcH/YjgK/YiaL family protein
MIIDEIAQIDKYDVMHPRFAKAFDYIKNIDTEKLENGKFEIEGNDIFAIHAADNGVSMLDSIANFECHNTYIDIQYVYAGIETVGYKSRDLCVEPRGEYNSEKDVLFYEDAPDFFFKLYPGQFGIYFPNDVHAPMIGEGMIKKLVIKVRLK